MLTRLNSLSKIGKGLINGGNNSRSSTFVGFDLTKIGRFQTTINNTQLKKSMLSISNNTNKIQNNFLSIEQIHSFSTQNRRFNNNNNNNNSFQQTRNQGQSKRRDNHGEEFEERKSYNNRNHHDNNDENLEDDLEFDEKDIDQFDEQDTERARGSTEWLKNLSKISEADKQKLTEQQRKTLDNLLQQQQQQKGDSSFFDTLMSDLDAAENLARVMNSEKTLSEESNESLSRQQSTSNLEEQEDELEDEEGDKLVEGEEEDNETGQYGEEDGEPLNAEQREEQAESRSRSRMSQSQFVDYLDMNEDEIVRLMREEAQAKLDSNSRPEESPAMKQPRKSKTMEAYWDSKLQNPWETHNVFYRVIEVGRHAKITPAGKELSVSVLLVTGNGNGTAGVGYGKAEEVSLATQYAFRDAKKHLATVYRYQDRTIPHKIKYKWRATKIVMIPHGPNNYIRAMKPLVFFAEAFGLWDISIKTYGSRNLHNVIVAMYRALRLFVVAPEEMAKARGKKLFNFSKARLNRLGAAKLREGTFKNTDRSSTFVANT